MSSTASDFIAATGNRASDANGATPEILDEVIANQDLSLTARALYALVLAQNGQPLNPYADAIEDADDIRKAIDELVIAGLIVRV